MALLSPGIEIFESSVTPPASSVPAGNGVATLGFSTKGPTNKLVRIQNVDEFRDVFGDPIAEDPYAHILARSVLLNGTDVYFMRLAYNKTEAEAQCPVMADLSIKGATVGIKVDASTPNLPTNGYLTTFHKGGTNSKPTHESDLKFRVELANPAGGIIAVDTDANFTNDKFGNIVSFPEGYTGVIYIDISKLQSNLEEKAGKYYNFVRVNNEDNGQVGLLISAKNSTVFKDADVTLESSIGYVSESTWYYIKGSETGNKSGGPTGTAYGAGQSGSGTNDAVSNEPLCLVTNDVSFNGVTIKTRSSLSNFDDDLSTYSRFNLVAVDSGEGMNGVRVVKTTVTPVIGGESTWTVSVYNKDATTPVETREGITRKNFLTEMSKFSTIFVKDFEYGDDKGIDTWDWVDGTWELGEGLILSNGDTWVPADSGSQDEDYIKVAGKNGFPLVKEGDHYQYSESIASTLYTEALGKDEFLNADEYSFSILATPGIQASDVQESAINVCEKRGDAIYLADIPVQYCKNRQGIDSILDWSNGNIIFRNSYCAIYYGWFAETNPYDSENSIFLPASCLVAPKMVAIDRSLGEFYAPAGITRGSIICSDWYYSPDQKDRDKLVGDNNVVNPISYSNTRGMVIMAQKTTDRTTSPLNRVGIRRMTNAIKRDLRSRLVSLLFEPNNETARAKARTIVDNIMSGLRTTECIESYDINVVSGTGANRNDLNIYLSFAPYGLIEKIYVYLSITDAGVEVTETVA